MLFAEGTSSDGNRVLPFRSALVGAVSDAAAHQDFGGKVMIQPMSIGYTGLHGMPMGRQHRPLVAWYGDLDFMPHFKDFIARGAVDAVVSYGEPVAADDRHRPQGHGEIAGSRGARAQRRHAARQAAADAHGRVVKASRNQVHG